MIFHDDDRGVLFDDAPPLVDQRQQQEMNEERRYFCVCAVRECLTHGVSSKTIRLLCSELGITFDEVTGG